MLADVNIDLVVSFLRDAKSMAAFARTDRLTKDVVYANIPVVLKSAEHKMTKYQKETLCNLTEDPGLGHVKAIVERKCLVCHTSYKGGIRAPWGIPAHPECTKRLETNVRYVNGGIPTEIMPLVRATIPVNIRGGYSTYHGEFEFETVIPKAIPGVISENMTLAHFYEVHADRVNAWLEKVRAEKSAKEEKRKRAAEEQRVARQKKQKVLNEERREAIAGIVDTSYLKWMRTVPKFGKKFVSTLSAEQSVAAANTIRANADLREQVHEAVLKSSRIRELGSAYAFVREYGEEAVILLRRGYGINDARGILVARKKRAEKRAKVGSSGTGRECSCGFSSAMKCKYSMCGSCCPRYDCERHR